MKIPRTERVEMDSNSIGPTIAERELRRLAGEVGVSVFKLVVDDVSILASVDVIPGDANSRKATYRPYQTGLILAALDDVSAWMQRIARRA